MARVRCLLAALLLAIPLVVIQAGPARACTCERDANVKAALAESAGAFVGVLVAQGLYTGPARAVDPELGNVNRFVVELTVKGEIGEFVDVLDTGSGASCGLELSVGDRSGLLLGRAAGEWVSSMCAKADPNALVAAAADEPRRRPLSAVIASEKRLLAVTGVVLLALPLGLAVRRAVRRRS